MKLKIVSKGEASNTRVVDAASGEPLEGVIGVNWSFDGGEPEVTITVRAAIDAVVDTEPVVDETPVLDEELELGSDEGGGT